MKLITILVLLISGQAIAAEVPKYKPSSRSSAAIDITSNEYGYSNTAPQALGIGDTAPDFTVPGPFGSEVTLSDYAAKGPVVLIFYRGHW